MRTIPPNRQTGVVPHLFSRIEELDEQRSPQQSTQGSTSPLEFGQDLVKVLGMILLYSARRPCAIRSPSSSCGRSPRSRPSLKREHRRHAVADLVADATYPGDTLRRRGWAS